jgi:D-alanine-D-alanine ligase
MKKNIAVITGGEASEVGISLKSAAVVCANLNSDNYNIYKIVIDGTNWWYTIGEERKTLIDKNDFSLTLDSTKINFDAVFVALHGTPAEDGKLQGYFDLLKIPYNCCGVLQAALTFDKAKTKDYLAHFGIKTAQSVLGLKSEAVISFHNRILKTLSFPVFVKPNKNGSSYGAAKVDSQNELMDALNNAFNYDNEVIVEEFLKGREVTNGVFTHNGIVHALPITEIRSKNEFFDYKAKYEGDSQEITPAEIDAALTKSIQETSVFIYKQLEFKGMCRIDYIITENGYYMLEVNSIPGISAESIVPQQARAMGFSLPEFFGMSIEECLRK